jgi:aminoglycoside phosphotransferase (APT) family kinase protein
MTVTEIPLTGGAAQAGSVVRVGPTVRRPIKPFSASVHSVLKHLERTGFTAAPRFLGVDEQGREILDYLPGQALLPPVPAWAQEPATLAEFGALVRRLHDALRGYRPAPDQLWDQHAPPRWQGDLICHNDLVMSNVILDGRTLVGLIDFDMCAPGTPAWELGCAARHWVPLRGEGPEGPDRAVVETGRRLCALLDGYGLPYRDRPAVLQVVLEAELIGLRLLRQKVVERHEAYLRMWCLGAPLRIADRLCWVTTHRAALTEAICPPG